MYSIARNHLTTPLYITLTKAGYWQNCNQASKNEIAFNVYFYNFRVLKVLGCQHGCHNSIRPGQHSMAANTTPSGGDISALRTRGVAILSRLLWYDKKQFKAYLTLCVETKTITFLLNFLHGYLSFCCDPTSPFANVNVSTTVASNQTASQQSHTGASSKYCSRKN